MQDNSCYWVNVKSNQEDDGRLLVIENNTEQIPFEIKRIFWVRDVKENAQRGQHATKRTNLVLVAITGSCDVVVTNGKEEKVFHLDNPTKGLYIEKMLWRTMKNFSKDCIVEAICDQKYSPNDETYDDFEEYLSALNGN